MPTDKFSRRAIASAFAMSVVAAVLFGAATPASKVLLANVPALQLAAMLSAGAALAAFPFALRGRLPLPWCLPAGQRRKLFNSLFFGGVLGPVLLLAGLKMASAASVSMWLNLELVFTVGLAHFFLGEHVGRRGWLAVFGAATAAAMLSMGEGAAGLAGGVLVALACLCWAIDNNSTATLDGITPPQIVFWKGSVSAVVNGCLGLIITPELPAPTLVIAGLVIGMFCFGSSIVLYITAQHALGATRTQTVFSSAPFWGLLLSAMFLREPISLLQIAAALLMIAVVVLLFTDRHGHHHRHDQLKHTHRHGHDDNHHVPHDGLPAWHSHTHEHEHDPLEHSHEHVPDLHHKHRH